MSIFDLDAKLAQHLPAGISSSRDAFGLSFLDVFKSGFKGNARLRLQRGDDNYSGFSDGLLLRNCIHYKPTLPGKDLQATLNELQAAKENLKNKVRYVITFDGKFIAARDLSVGDAMFCALADLQHEFFFFSVLYGEPRYIAAAENKADQDAAVALSKIYNALKQSDPSWATAHAHDVNTFMTRLLFCLFAEDTELFEPNLFTNTLVARGGAYGQDVQELIGNIYRILNTPNSRRDNEPAWLCKFPYVNGDVFALEGIHIPVFNAQAFHYLKEAGEQIDWKEVHPDILGSAIQKITDPAERHSLGMHYTSVTNIDKLLGPLFLDQLREARDKANASGTRRVANLQKLLFRIGQIKVFDPACGSGNFLVIAYKRLRELEIKLLNDLRDAGEHNVGMFSQITLHNFYGIEYADFAAETAKISLRIAEQQMDAMYGDQFNRPTVCLPLRSPPNIHTGSALAVDWNSVCPASQEDEVYICGNPPYLGYQGRNEEQNKEHVAVMGQLYKDNNKTLDYVCNWFVLAFLFSQTRNNARFAFVSTNSVIQGSHVNSLWPALLDGTMEISFLYPSFKWSNLAGNNAGVSCVILGMQHKNAGKKRLFLNDGEVNPDCINAYGMPSKNVFIGKRNAPISHSLPEMSYGSMPNDGGFLHLSEEEKNDILQEDSRASRFIRRLIGSQEMLKGITRYCLWITEEDCDHALKINKISQRIGAVRKSRASSTRDSTRKLASTPYAFGEIRHVDCPRTLVIPRVSSGERQYIPVDCFSDGEIINDSAFMIPNAELWQLAILSSTLHCRWLDAVAGKLEDRYRYSNTLVWNTFPLPELTEEQKHQLNRTGQKVLNARHFHPDLTLGDMYNTENMGPELLAAHQENDRVLEKIFRDKPFKDDDDRLAHLFERYAAMTSGEAK